MTRSRPATDLAGQLGEHRALLALARSLVRDPDVAEDLVQETWLAGLQRGAAPAERLRYLRGVLRNLVRRRRRSEGRRLRHETAAARRDEAPPADAWLERVRVQRCIADAVLALDEPYRATLLARFWEGLPPRAIAARHGVPVATVHTRLQRALQRIRGRLDREAPGGRDGWMVVVLAMAMRPLPAPAETSGLLGRAAAHPVSMMSMSLVLSTILVSLWAALPSDSGPATSSVRPFGSDPGGSGIAAAAVEPIERRLAAPDGSPAGAHEPVRLRILDAGGVPVVGAVVRGYPGEHVLPSDLPEGVVGARELASRYLAGTLPRRSDEALRTPLFEVLSDADGHAAVPRGAPGTRLHIVGPDLSSSGWVAMPGPEGERTVRLAPACRIRGVVRDVAGRPVGDVSVGFLSVGGVAGFSARTPEPCPVGADGRFDAPVDPFASYVLEVRGGPPAELRRVRAEPGAIETVELRLLGAAHLAVQVVDATGAPLDGAVVRARHAVPEAGATELTRQCFAAAPPLGGSPLIALPAGGRYEVTAEHAEHAFAARVVDVLAGEIGAVTLVASAERIAVEGVVLGADGRPLPGAGVSCRESPASRDLAGPALVVRADGAGRFRVDGLVAGLAHDFAWQPDPDRPTWVARRLGVVVVRGRELALEPAAPRSIDLEVVEDATGAAVPAFRYALGVATEQGWRVSPAVDVADPDGACRVDGLQPGAPFRVIVEAPDRGRRVVEAVEGESARLVVRMRPAARLAVRVQDPTGAAVRHAAVRVLALEGGVASWMWGGLRVAHTDAAGNVVIDGLGAGSHRLTVDAGAQGGCLVDVDLAPGESAERTLVVVR